VTEGLPYTLIRTKAAGVIVLDSEYVDGLPHGRVEVLSRHRTWEAANAARAKLKEKS
jgi:hypothetical protein